MVVGVCQIWLGFGRRSVLDESEVMFRYRDLRFCLDFPSGFDCCSFRGWGPPMLPKNQKIRCWSRSWSWATPRWFCSRKWRRYIEGQIFVKGWPLGRALCFKNIIIWGNCSIGQRGPIELSVQRDAQKVLFFGLMLIIILGATTTSSSGGWGNMLLFIVLYLVSVPITWKIALIDES